MLSLAHLGHWYESVAYAMPMVLIGGVLWYTSRRDRLAETEQRAEPTERWEDDPRLRDD